MSDYGVMFDMIEAAWPGLVVIEQGEASLSVRTGGGATDRPKIRAGLVSKDSVRLSYVHFGNLTRAEAVEVAETVGEILGMRHDDNE